MRYSLSLLIYRVVLLLLLPVIILLLIIRSINHPAYRHRLIERLGFVSSAFKKHGVVIHAASVGEVIAIKAFVEQLIKAQPDLAITLTTFTPTGSAQVKKIFHGKVQHCYLPLDVFPCTWLFLKSLAPKAVVLMETELWPNFIAQCQSRAIKLLLINARLSNKSMKDYRKLSWLITPCLQRFDHILAQSDDNQQNFLTLGAKPSQCQVSGNLKFDLHISDEVSQKQQMLAEFILPPRKTWLVASTHPNDEELILSCLTQLKQQHPDLLLILVPRHPERFDSVDKLCQQCGFSTVRRSQQAPVTANDDIWLIDTLGELLATCGLADVVTMGGSFSHIGGHNPLEPALFKKPIVVGHDMSNFNKVMQQMRAQQAIVQLATDQQSSKEDISSALFDAINELLLKPEQQKFYGENAYQVVHVNQGASQFSTNYLLNNLL